MGLSSEERLSKFYNALSAWRSELVQLRNLVPNRYHQPARAAVQRWINEVDVIAGEMITRTDTNSAYWILGSNERNYQSIYQDHYGVSRYAPGADPDQGVSLSNEATSGSARWFEYEITLVEFTGYMLGGSMDHDEEVRVRLFACWWSAWAYIEAILYPLKRYHDGLFPKRITRRFERLIGEIANSRYDVCSLGGGKDEARKYEHALLTKWKLYHYLIRERVREYEKEISSDKSQFKTLNEAQWNRGYETIKEIKRMSLVQVERYINDVQTKEWETKHKSADKKPADHDSILGSPVRSEEELRRIIETSTNYEEVKTAAEECHLIYGVSIGWENRFSKRTKQQTKS